MTSHSAEGKARHHAPGENTVRDYETNPAASPFSWPILSKYGVRNSPRRFLLDEVFQHRTNGAKVDLRARIIINLSEGFRIPIGAT